MSVGISEIIQWCTCWCFGFMQLYLESFIFHEPHVKLAPAPPQGCLMHLCPSSVWIPPQKSHPNPLYMHIAVQHLIRIAILQLEFHLGEEDWSPLKPNLESGACGAAIVLVWPEYSCAFTAPWVVLTTFQATYSPSDASEHHSRAQGERHLPLPTAVRCLDSSWKHNSALDFQSCTRRFSPNWKKYDFAFYLPFY